MIALKILGGSNIDSVCKQHQNQHQKMVSSKLLILSCSLLLRQKHVVVLLLLLLLSAQTTTTCNALIPSATRRQSRLLFIRFMQSDDGDHEDSYNTNEYTKPKRGGSRSPNNNNNNKNNQSAKKRYQQTRQQQRSSSSSSSSKSFTSSSYKAQRNNKNNSNNNIPRSTRKEIEIDLSKPKFTYQTLAPALQLTTDNPTKPLSKKQQQQWQQQQNSINPTANNNIPPAKYTTSPSVQKQNASYCVPYICGELPILYTNDPRSVEKWACDNIIHEDNNNFSFIGFDVEAVPNVPWMKNKENKMICNRPSTVQLSTPFSSLVFQLTSDYETKRKQLLPLQGILSDPTIIKAGAGIDDDMLELYRWDKSLQAKCRFDLGGIGSSSSGMRVGLQRLVRAIVGVELLKHRRVVMSDWSQVPLSIKQLNYASRDAWAGAAVIENLNLMYEDTMNVDLIGSKVLEIERDMKDLDLRAGRRKKAKNKVRKHMNAMKVLSEYVRKGVDYIESEDGKEINLVEEIEYLKEQIYYSKQIMDETAPDGLLFFPPEMFGLDFCFEEEVSSMKKTNTRPR